MNLPVTAALFVGFLLLGIFAGWRGSRPSDPLKGVRMIPWRPLMVASTVAALLLLVHLANLVGIQTGR